jgi:hypothetical protein
MYEGSQSGVSAVNPEYPESAARQPTFAGDYPLPGMPAGRNLLPANSATNVRLSRSAETLGRGLASAVLGVRSVSDRFGVARSRLHVVSSRTRQNASAAALELMDSAAERATNWRDAAEAWVVEATERADRNWSRLSNEARNRLHHLQNVTIRGVDNARAQAQQQLRTAGRRVQQWEQEEPLKVLATVGGAAFVAGAVIRIWRSSRD